MAIDKRLSQITPDFDELHALLRSKLQTKDTWIDALPTSVGTAVLDLFAGMGTSYQYSAESAFREAFYESARRDSSVFAATRMLGNRISRKIPASVTTNLINHTGSTIYIVPYSTFTIGANTYYNRVQLQIGPGQLGVNIPLHEGVPATKTFDLSTLVTGAYYEYFMDIPGFIIANSDVSVFTVNKTTQMANSWKIVHEALWEHSPGERICYESTLGNGDMSLIFGDGYNGLALSQNDELHVRYVLTKGSKVNSGLPGEQVRYTSLEGIDYIGETTSQTTPGSDEKDSSYYKTYNGVTARSRRKAISKPAIQAAVASFPGVADATVLVQRDIAPYDLRWMNMFRICILPDTSETFGGINPNPKSVRWNDLIVYLEDKIHAAVQIQTWNPTMVPIRLVVDVGIYPTEDIEDIKLKVRNNIQLLFQKNIGTLGKRLALSDIVSSSKIKGVDYVRVLSPTEDIVPEDKLTYVGLVGAPEVNVFYSERVTPSEDIPTLFTGVVQ